MRRPLRHLLAAAAALAVVAVAGCAGQAGDRSARSGEEVYVSLGDSYAAGTKPRGVVGGATTKDAFPYQVAQRISPDGTPVELVNLGCSGATSYDIVANKGCGSGVMGPDSTTYPNEPQVEAAESALRANSGRIRLVTIVIGGNDVSNCLSSTGAHGDFRANTATQDCLTTALAGLRDNLTATLSRVRAIVGPDVRIVGITYPDSFLGLYTRRDADSEAFAEATQDVFRNELNPVLRSTYTAADADFIDITQLTGGYGSLAQTTDLQPYGQIPVPVANVCRYTYMCSAQDVHPTEEGHTFIADQILAAATPAG